MIAQTWSEVIARSLQNLWSGFIGFLPSFIGALIILIVGLVVATGLGSLVEKIFTAIKLDQLLSKLGLAPYLERAGLKLRAARFLGGLTYWFLVIAFILAVSDILGLFALSGFLGSILSYLPNIIAAVLILLASVILGGFLRRVVIASVASARIHAANFLGSLTWWSVVLFGFLTALVQLNIAPSIINSIITGFIAMLALAGGLAFGLGGRDYASSLISKLRDHTESKR